MLGNFSCFCCHLLKKKIFPKIFSEILSECQTVCVQISGLNWVQTVCKGYQQRTKVATSKERVKMTPTGWSTWTLSVSSSAINVYREDCFCLPNQHHFIHCEYSQSGSWWNTCNNKTKTFTWTHINRARTDLKSTWI